jgi:hypothetical protein
MRRKDSSSAPLYRENEACSSYRDRTSAHRDFIVNENVEIVEDGHVAVSQARVAPPLVVFPFSPRTVSSHKSSYRK